MQVESIELRLSLYNIVNEMMFFLNIVTCNTIFYSVYSVIMSCRP